MPRGGKRGKERDSTRIFSEDFQRGGSSTTSLFEGEGRWAGGQGGREGEGKGRGRGAQACAVNHAVDAEDNSFRERKRPEAQGFPERREV